MQIRLCVRGYSLLLVLARILFVALIVALVSQYDLAAFLLLTIIFAVAIIQRLKNYRCAFVLPVGC